MAKRTSKTTAALEYLETGNAPEAEEVESGETLDETLNELATEQEEAAPAPEEVEAAEVEEAPKPKIVTKGKAAVAAPVVEEAAEASEEDADGNVAEVDPNVLSEDVANLPRVQELIKTEETFGILGDVLSEGYGYDLTDPTYAFNRLRAERSDAAMLYSIVDGTLPAASLLTQFEKGVKDGVFPQEMIDRIDSSLADHLATSKYLDTYLGERGLAVVPKGVVEELLKHAKANNIDFSVPSIADAVNAQIKADPTASLRQELEALKRQINGGGQVKNGQQQAQGAGDATYPNLNAEQVKVQKAFDTEVKKFMSEKKVPDDLFPEYHKAILEMVQSHPGGSTAIIKRIAAGNFVDIRRMAVQYNNTMIERAKRYTGGVTQGAPKVVKKAGSGAVGGKPNGLAKVGKQGIDKAARIASSLKLLENEEN